MTPADDLAAVLTRAGWSRAAARVLAVLMLTDEPLSSADLAAELGASAGSVSTAIRELTDRGDVREVRVAASRRHWFRAADDLGDGAVGHDRPQLLRSAAIITELLASLTPDQDGPRRRLTRLHDRLVWLDGYQQRMESAWADHLRQRDPLP
ncbi:MarR family transcriptional regulator [Jiangella aurantiaca]|uniref:MarR family transcriptional regulator n=1 Tax=Jiangella aurantiaca TaxID=2530373 RepID=A0A4R5A5W5_9ACTN|nr:MarR family transcriptional regulator [Jiangella aurantiaca]TDD66376.1 MarR family transcriptional regulator [Jiangella aurantiaca]